MVFKPEEGFGWLRSPVSSRPCLTIEGDADAIEAAGEAFRSVGRAMRGAARELGELSREESYRAQSFDAIRDEAGQAERDLEQAAIRYVGSDGTTGTAKALCDYAVSLRRVQFLAGPGHVEHIRRAHEANEERQSALAAAQREVNGLDSPLQLSEPTAEERRTAGNALTSAETLAGGADELLSGLWENFDSAIAEWETAYDDAVAGIESAIDLSDIDDSWWEDALDVLITIATVVGIAAAIVAMVIASPLAALIATVAGIVILVATIVMAVGGRRKDGVDVAFAIVGVIPFGKALGSGQGIRSAVGLTSRASQGTAAAGRAAIIDDLALWSSRGSTHAAAVANAGNRAARVASAPRIVDAVFDSRLPGWAQRITTGIRTGGGRYDIEAMRVSSLIDDVFRTAGGSAGQRSSAYLADHAMPSVADQALNVWNFSTNSLDSVTGGAATDAVGDPIRDLVGAVEDRVTGR